MTISHTEMDTMPTAIHGTDSRAPKKPCTGRCGKYDGLMCNTAMQPLTTITVAACYSDCAVQSMWPSIMSTKFWHFFTPSPCPLSPLSLCVHPLHGHTSTVSLPSDTSIYSQYTVTIDLFLFLAPTVSPLITKSK